MGQTGRREVVPDPKTLGLRAELREGGRVTFYLFRRMPGGGPVRVRLGTYPDISPDEARTLASETIGRMARGEDVAAVKRQKRAEATLEELFTRWLSDAKQRKKSWPEDQRMFNKYLTRWHGRKLSALSKPEVKAWHTRLGTKSGHYQANRALALLRALYNAADDAVGYAGQNPAAKIKPFAESERDRFVQPDEMPRFFRAVLEEPSEVVRDFVFLCLFTGERRSQVLAMRWDDMNLDRAEWRLPTTKQKKKHYVHLTAPALAILRRREKDAEGEWVLPGRRKGQHLKDPMKNWRRILAAAGMSDMRIHDLRRTLGSFMAIQGASLAIIGRALGHSRPETTKIYARLTDQSVAEKVTGAVKLIQKSAKRKA